MYTLLMTKTRDRSVSGQVSIFICQSMTAGLYLSVHDCWIPVVIRFSPEIGDWVFQNLENVNVNGQKVMIKS